MTRRARTYATVSAAALGLALLRAERAAAAGPRLLVFLHTAVKQRALQDALSDGLPGVQVSAVGRIADFERGLSEKPDAVLSLPVVLQSKRLSSALLGQRAGAVSEKYVIVGTDRAPDPGKVSAVGALDILGRSGTNAFVSELLGASPRVVRVTKVEDLLPLLQMRRADAIVLPARLHSALAEASRLELLPRELPAAVGLPAVASLNSGGPALVAAVRRLPVATAKLIGVDAWR